MLDIDKRKFRRFTIPLRASIQFTDSDKKPQNLDITVKNIGAGGLFFDPAAHIHLNTTTNIELTMSVPDNYDDTMHNEIISTTGTVIRHETGGIAIQFNRNLLEIEQNLLLINTHLYSNINTAHTKTAFLHQ